jgi:predicted dehydrogenase
MVKLGIIGAGAIARSGYEGFSKSQKAEVVAICDRNTGRREAFAREYGVPRTYAEASELLADKDIQGVYVALPNVFHVPVSKAALEAGKHVILEKPFAMNYAEAAQLQEVIKSSGKVFTLGMNQRFNQDSQKIKTLAEQGYFGDIYHAKAYWRRRSGIPKKGTWFGSSKMAGGGCILDIGVHMLDLCLYTVDNFKPEAVSGATYTRFGNRGLGHGGWGKSDDEAIPFDVDDFATALIKLEGGLTVGLDVSWACHQKDRNFNNVEIYGDSAGATLYPAQVFTHEEELGAHMTADNLNVKIKYPHTDRFCNFVHSILGEEEPCAPIEQALVIQKILDGIKESAATGKEVRL